MKHGASAYRNGRCRCDVCRQGNTDRTREKRQQRRLQVPPARVHGTVGGYQNWGCRCDACCKAHALRLIDWKDRTGRYSGGR